MPMSIKGCFTHLHCHTQYSLLDGAAKISSLIKKAKSMDMHSLAITDHGNMFGVPQFVSEANKQGIKPIIGCEFYLCQNRFDYKDNKRFHQIILAKNKEGYKNLLKLSSFGYTEGYYYKPRIDRDLIIKYREGLIATTCCLGSEVCQAILNKPLDDAEKCFLSWLDIWGEDYYIEVQPPYSEEQKKCNEILLSWSKKHNVPAIATNDVHYVNQEDSVAQDILVCLQTGKDYNDPTRLKFSTDQFFLKSTEEMASSFLDNLEVIENTQFVADKIENISLKRDILMPIFQIPENFKSQAEYLRFLTYEGAKRNYSVLTPEITSRIEFELNVIESMGFEGYFLVVQDFVWAARRLNVAVGPGRGSAVGSIVSYCTGITTICPLEYNLIFERFLNPERVSMPDIDIDFDDIGREKVIQYVVERYGKNQVAQIVTFGSMGAKSAIKDVARVIGLPLERANFLSKLVPDKPGTSLSKSLQEIPELSEIYSYKSSKEYSVLAMAETLEGSARHSGVHAAGIIIAPDDITNYIPVKKDKDTDFLITQYDGSVVESVGMLKMDFLGLRSLSIIKDCVALVKKNHNIDIDIEKIPLDDKKTFELYQRGDTIGTFQFESDGMRQWLIKLCPTNIEDLIAMNALYRPGPMQFIPNYIARKHGRESVELPHELLKDVVSSTFGIMIYQEQIIKAAQVMAGYTAGSADILRKAMGKKIASEMEKQKAIFIEGALRTNNVPKEKSIEIFEIMEKFAQYGFNRSHSTAYSMVAFQTAYLKANFPAEYMCTLLSNNQDDMDKVILFIADCKKMGIKVLGPCINNSEVNFTVKNGNEIRFGLGAIKGLGSSSAETIMKFRKSQFKDFFDFIDTVPGLNKKILESLVLAGALDCFEQYNRKQFFEIDKDATNFIEKILKYIHNCKGNASSDQLSLFGEMSFEITKPKRPVAPDVEDYSILEKLKFEKELIGFYLSGHPLDKYEMDIQNFSNCNLQNYKEISQKDIKIVGILSSCKKRYSKSGKPYLRFTLEDKMGSVELAYFVDEKMVGGVPFADGMAVLVLAAFVPAFNDPSSMELKVSKIYALDYIRHDLCNKVSIFIDLSTLSMNDANILVKYLRNSRGNLPVELNFMDEPNKKKIQTAANSIKSDIETLSKLNECLGVSCKMHAKI